MPLCLDSLSTIGREGLLNRIDSLGSREELLPSGPRKATASTGRPQMLLLFVWVSTGTMRPPCQHSAKGSI